jgi:hypothetical protein
MQMPTNNLLRFPPDSSAPVMHERYSRTWWWQIAYLSNLLCVSARFQPPLSPCPTSHCFVDGFFVRKSHVTQAVQAMKKPNLAAIRSIRTTTYTLARPGVFSCRRDFSTTRPAGKDPHCTTYEDPSPSNGRRGACGFKLPPYNNNCRWTRPECPAPRSATGRACRSAGSSAKPCGSPSSCE